MNKRFINKTQSSNGDVEKKALLFGLTSVLLYGIGFGLTVPVLPFLVARYVTSVSNQAVVVALLTFVYAVCVFLAAPGLGALSDRYGRRPVLLICLLGSALGYLVFGIGGALWVLFLGRIIDGLTGGNISTILAYFADITPKTQRIKYFGWAGAASGIGFIIGPSLGGILAKFGYTIPMYFGVVITLINAAYGAIYMPESLTREKRLTQISLVKLNPFKQLESLVTIKNLKWIFLAMFLIGIPSGSLQTFFSQFAKDTFSWEPVTIGVVFSLLGATDIITQSIIMPKLLTKLDGAQLAVLGLNSEIIAYGFIAASGIFSYFPLFILGTIMFGFGDAIISPAVNGIASEAVSSDEQGKLQGGGQSVQALTRIIGPILGGILYISLGHFAPAIMGMVFIALAIVTINKGSKPHRKS